MKQLRLTILMAAAAALLGTPLLAAGPVDVEVGAVWWANNFDSAGGVSSFSADAGSPGYRAELWLFRKYGVRAGVYSAEGGDFSTQDTDYASIDVLWRPYSPTENTFVSLGLGWEEVSLDSIGLAGDTAGARLSAGGRFGLVGMAYLYADASYLPELDDAPASDPGDGRFEELSGYEAEAGVAWKLGPFVGLRAGYRVHHVEFSRTGFDPEGSVVEGEADSDGFLAGLTLRF